MYRTALGREAVEFVAKAAPFGQLLGNANRSLKI